VKGAPPLSLRKKNDVVDLYLTSLALGGVGLGAMAMSGFLHHGSHGSHATHAAHGSHGAIGAHGLGSAGHGHAGGGHGGGGHGGGGHGGAHGSAHGGGHGHAGNSHSHGGHDAHGGAHAQHGGHGLAGSLLTLMSPRVLFSVCLGLGTAGLVLRPALGEGPLLFVAALAGGAAFERYLVSPVWNLLFRFASNPALTLESATGGEATAVSSFDANGQGLIAVEVDGQMFQLLGTLSKADREFKPRVPTGTKLRVEDVDAARNRCTVSLL